MRSKEEPYLVETAKKYNNSGNPPIGDAPHSVLEGIFFQELGDFDTVNQFNDMADALGEEMAESIAYGFASHDRRAMDDAVAYFFAKDINMFPDRDPSDVMEASMAYVEALDNKDRLEFFHAPRSVQEELAGDSFDNYSLEELMELDTEEANRMGVGGVDTAHLGEEGIEELGESDGWRFISEEFERREEALREDDVPELEGIYYENDTDFWRQHKTDRDYLDACINARLAELYYATGDEGFAEHALRDQGKYDSVKNSDGMKGPTPLPLLYVQGVELHDHHSEASWNAIPGMVAPFYKGTLLPRVRDDYDTDDVTDFGISYSIESGEQLEKQLEELIPHSGPSPKESKKIL